MKLPKDGQTVVFKTIPPGSWLAAGEPYRVDAPRAARELRFVSLDRGSSGYAPTWAVARADWQTMGGI